MKKMDLLGINLSTGDYDDFLSRVIASAQGKRALTIAPIAIHSLVLEKFDKKYRRILNRIDHVLPDSFWVLWGVNFLYKSGLQERFYGPDLMKDLCIEANKENLKIFLYGGKNRHVLDELEKWFNTLGSGKGKIHKYLASFSITNEEIDGLAKRVNRLGKGIMFLGIGSPLQHQVLIKLKDKLDMPIVAVGAAFNLLSGEEKQAPKYLRRHGFEWLYRLAQNPRRLAGRYFLSLLYFPFIIKEKLKMVSF